MENVTIPTKKQFTVKDFIEANTSLNLTAPKANRLISTIKSVKRTGFVNTNKKGRPAALYSLVEETSSE